VELAWVDSQFNAVCEADMEREFMKTKLPGRLCLATTVLSLAMSNLLAAETKPAAKKVNYADDVRPIFREHCFSCHNQNKATNDLALDSYERIRKGGASGDAFKAGELDNSLLWLVMDHQSEPHMPPNADKLPAAKLATIKQWILDGALKDSGSKADTAKGPAVNLNLTVGAAKPAGPAILPEGLSRQPIVHTARPAAVTAIASSPWAPVVAVAGQKQIVLYHSDTAALLGILPFPEGIPHVLKFSRSGAILLAGGGEGAKQGLAVAYDVRTGKRLFQLGDELDVVLAADISPDHSKVALGGPQKIVRVLKTSDGSQLFEVRKHTDWIYGAEFSPDGVLLATADRSGGLFVWEAETGREFHNLEGHKGGVTAVSFRGDSNVLASGSEDGTIKLWNMEDGKQIRSFSAHGSGVTDLAFTHDGRLVSSGRDRQAKVWDASGKQLRAFDSMKEIVLKTAFTHDGNRVAAGDWTGEIRLWNAADGKQVALLASNPPPPAEKPATKAKP
jgi:WD40 repeat protein